MTNDVGRGPANPWLRAIPVLFVLIWSTGFIVARYGMPHAPPMKFLAVRYALSIVCFLPWIALAGVAWPRSRAQWLHLGVTGVLMHGGYLGGVWIAVKGGLGAGLAALVVGLQPLLTAMWLSSRQQQGGLGGSGAGHRVTARQWLGLCLGLIGLLLVVGHKLHLGEASWRGLGFAVLALASITVGTLYQKRWLAACDVRTANSVQLMAALAVTLPLALLEAEPVRWHPEMIGAMAWSVLVLTLGGSSLLYLLIQRGAAASVTSLMYLVPPSTALIAWLLFDERLAGMVLVGMALAVWGVYLARK